jgi:hypothetical protein
MALAPFNPADSIYDDLDVERFVVGGFVSVEPDLSAGYYGPFNGAGRSASAGDAARIVWADSGGDIVTATWVDPRGWMKLLGTNTDDGAAGIFGPASLPWSVGGGYDNASLTARVEGAPIRAWVAVKEYDGMGGAAWTTPVEILKSDGDVSVPLGSNGADDWRVWFYAKP